MTVEWSEGGNKHCSSQQVVKLHEGNEGPECCVACGNDSEEQGGETDSEVVKGEMHDLFVLKDTL